MESTAEVDAAKVFEACIKARRALKAASAFLQNDIARIDAISALAGVAMNFYPDDNVKPRVRLTASDAYLLRNHF